MYTNGLKDRYGSPLLSQRDIKPTLDTIQGRLDDLESQSGGGHSIGEQWISFDGTIPEGGVPFLGQILNVELYQELYNWAKQNNKIITETEWLQIRDENNGNVPYYSNGDGVDAKEASATFTTSYYISKFVVNGVEFPVFMSDDNSETIASEVERLNAMSDFPVIMEYVQNTTRLAEPEAKGDTKTFNIYAKVKGTIGNDYLFQFVTIENNTYDVSLSGGSESIVGTTFRMPMFSGYFKGSGTTTGIEYIPEGLPNITGKAGPWENLSSYSLTSQGALGTELDGTHTIGGGGSGKYYFATLDASKSSVIYGNSEHVTPETTSVIVGVWAFGSYTNTSGLDLSDLKEALNVANTYDSMPLLSHYWDYKTMGNAGWVSSDGYWLSGDLYTDAYDKIISIYENQLPPITGISDDLTVKTTTYTLASDTREPYSFLLDTTNKMFRLPILNKSEKIVIYKRADRLVNGATDSNVYTTYYSDGTVKIEGVYDSTGLTSGTINWTVPLNIDYKVHLQDTKSTNSDTDTEGWQNFAGPGVYTATSLRISHYKASDRKVQFTIEGTPESYIVPSFRFMYFKLGNTFTNVENIDIEFITNKIDRVWDAWQDADYVVESWEDGTEWYRLYKSGWVEQGGKYIWDGSTTTPREIPITLYKEMFNTLYTVHTTSSNYTAAGYFPWVNSITTTGFILYASGTAGVRSDLFWRACGKVK